MGSKEYRNRYDRETEESLLRMAGVYGQKHGGGNYTINQENKLSAAIIDIVQPFLDEAETPAAKEGVLNMGVSAWLAALLPEHNAVDQVREHIQKMCGDNPEVMAGMQADFEKAIERKRRLYPDDMRMPLDFEIKLIGDKLQFNVVGTPIGSKPKSMKK